VKRRRGYTRLSRKNQVTNPVAVLERAGVGPGTEFRVEADEGGRIVLEPEQSLSERRREALRRIAGTFSGMYPPGYLDELRDEWEERLRERGL
jgi:bifunctional DNA-binding transcriptional regulator/antitoxin component of YhaV-PrlF toxin-antitoxin module